MLINVSKFILLLLLLPYATNASITYDTFTNGGYNAGTSLSFSHTMAGCSDPALFISVHNDGGDGVTGVTYNGVQTQRIAKQLLTGNQAGQGDYLYYSSSTNLGSANVSISSSQAGLTGSTASYCGVLGLGATSTNQTNGTHLQVSVPIYVSSAWFFMGIRNSNGTANTADSGTTNIISGDAFGIGSVHSNGTLSIGTTTAGVTFLNPAGNQVAGELVSFCDVVSCLGGSGSSTNYYTNFMSTTTDAAVYDLIQMWEVITILLILLGVSYYFFYLVKRRQR